MSICGVGRSLSELIRAVKIDVFSLDGECLWISVLD